MPTYDYECTHCGHKFEIFQRITEPPLNKCPKCRHKLRRLIGSGAGIIFSRKSLLLKNHIGIPKQNNFGLLHSGKGAGFYATDYRKKTPTAVGDKQDKTCPKIKDGCQGCQPQ